MSNEIVTGFADGIQRIQINRPEKKNALTVAMYADLFEALRAAADDRRVRVAVLHGHAGIFTAGNDLKDFLNDPPAGEDRPVFKFLAALTTFAKPLVAAVGGPAIGIGTTMLLHCDLVYASESARFQLPFVNLGIVPEAASSFLLPYYLGYHRAARLVLLGEPFSAQEARDYGLIAEVTANGAELDRAMQAAQALAAKPPEALRLSKQLMKKALAEPIARQMREEGALFTARLRMPEAIEAMTAFFEKRVPDFSRFD